MGYLKIFQKTTKNMVVYRGLCIKKLPKLGSQKFNSYLSTTTQPHVINRFASGCTIQMICKITLLKGSKIIPLSYFDGDKYNTFNEYEILCDRKATLTIKDMKYVKFDTNILYVNMVYEPK